MRSILRLAVAATIAIGGLTGANLLIAPGESPAWAAKAKPKKSRTNANNRSNPQTTGFEHQQCSVQQPCSTRNTW